ncbi:MAG: class I SAM-dependent methyltransferase [Alphaproteobacteria bacterium]|uniref:Class I SAM-dependent methyltransferase n=1 Tax=Candidatus Nitrobium versatile TaxID=2884831 RepID=A0A953J5V6_9BACT|nr:class I SAM-dependent methyltransferase [Candidatus Nitrobium versatile]
MDISDPEKERWDKKASAYVRAVEELAVTDTYEGVFRRLNTLKPVYTFFALRDEDNPVILDFGCGAGWSTVLLAQKAGFVYGFDISSRSIEVLKRKAEYNSIANLSAFVGNAERLPFEDGSFDYIFGNAILHHLDLAAVLPEIARLLKKGGKAAFCEPFGHNPVMNRYRSLKDKYIEKVKGIHYALTYGDRALFEKYFPYVAFIETSFLSDKVPFLRSLEALLLEKVRWTRKFASYVAIVLQK